MSDAQKRALLYLTGGLICVGLAVLYFTLRVRIHTFDALSYAWNVRDKEFGLLFHPHHLLYAPVGRIAYLTALQFGYNGYADAPIQLLNAAAGGMGVFLFWRFGARWTGQEWAALGTAALIGVCNAYWLYASEVEVYTLATVFLIACMWLLVVLRERPDPRTAALLGLAHTGAIMFHQTNALFAVPVAIFLLLDRHTPAIFLTYASVGALTTLGAYGAVGLASQFDTVGAFMDWFMGYTQSGLWGGFLAAEHLPALRSGLQVAVSTAWPLALAFYALGFVGVGRLIHQTIQDSNRLPWLVFGLLWLLIYGVFFWWWEPWNIEFWIASLPAWGMFILAALAPKEDSQLVAASLACVPFVLSALLVSAHLPQMRALNALEDDYFFQLTTALEPTLTTDDIVVTRGNVLDLYLPFYIEHPLVFSMREASFDAGSDRAALLTMVTARLDEAWRTGRIVVLDAYLFNQPLDPADNAFGLTEEEIDTLQSRYQWVEGPLLNGEPAFYTFPRYTDPTASAWSFDGSLLGWSAYGVSAPRFAEPGWCFTGGFDPQVSSPQLSLDASRFTQLEVDVSVSVSGLAAEIFWRTPESDYSLERSATLDLQRGRHTYTVNLAGMPGWQGTITRLRVDPIPGDQDGVDVCLYGIALTR